MVCMYKKMCLNLYYASKFNTFCVLQINLRWNAEAVFATVSVTCAETHKHPENQFHF